MDATQTKTLTPKQILTKTLAELGWEDPRECTITEVPREVRRCKPPIYEIELRDSRGCWRKRFTEEACTAENIGFKVGILEAMLRIRGQMDASRKITVDNTLGKEGWHQYFEDEKPARAAAK